ncbi:MAG: right-handed parallel beta-helix repeat-containing protein [Flavobacteriales bacterium]
MSQLKFTFCFLCHLFSMALFSQTIITSNTEVTPLNHDPNGYIVKSGTLTFNTSSTTVFHFKTNASVHVLTGGRVLILGGSFMPLEEEWKGIKLDGVSEDINQFILTISPKVNVTIAGALTGIKCSPVLTNGSIGKAANVEIQSNLTSQVNFQNSNFDLIITNNTYLENNSKINGIVGNGIHFYGRHGILIRNAKMESSLSYLDFLSNLKAVILENVSANLYRSKFTDVEYGIVGLETTNTNGIHLLKNEFVNFNNALDFNESNKLFVQDCHFNNGQHAFNVSESEEVSFYKNKIENTRLAMRAVNVEDIFILINTFKNNIEDVFLKENENINFTGNEISGTEKISYFGENNNHVLLQDNEFINCSTQENTIEIEGSENLFLYATTLKFTDPEVSTVEHSAVRLTSTINTNLLRNTFENYKYNALYFESSSTTTDFKTCLNKFYGNTEVAIDIVGQVNDQGNSIVPSNNHFNINFTNLNIPVRSTDSVVFFQNSALNYPSLSTNSSSIIQFSTSSGSYSECEPSLPLTTSSVFGYRISEEMEINSEDVVIFPNPVTNTFQVYGEEIDFSKELIIFDLLGRKMKVRSNGNQIDISLLPPAPYLLQVHLKSGEVSNKKLIKQ